MTAITHATAGTATICASSTGCERRGSVRRRARNAAAAARPRLLLTCHVPESLRLLWPWRRSTRMILAARRIGSCTVLSNVRIEKALVAPFVSHGTLLSRAHTVKHKARRSLSSTACQKHRVANHHAFERIGAGDNYGPE